MGEASVPQNQTTVCNCPPLSSDSFTLSLFHFLSLSLLSFTLVSVWCGLNSLLPCSAPCIQIHSPPMHCQRRRYCNCSVRHSLHYPQQLHLIMPQYKDSVVIIENCFCLILVLFVFLQFVVFHARVDFKDFFSTGLSSIKTIPRLCSALQIAPYLDRVDKQKTALLEARNWIKKNLQKFHSLFFHSLI